MLTKPKEYLNKIYRILFYIGASSSTEDVLLDHETDNESMVEGDNFKLEILPSTDFGMCQLWWSLLYI